MGAAAGRWCAEVLVTGKGFGAEPPSPSYEPPRCPSDSTGRLYGTKLYLTDVSAGWAAGEGGENGLGDCIGLSVVKWSKSKVTLEFGSNYQAVANWTLEGGDSYELHLLGASLAGTVTYRK